MTIPVTTQPYDRAPITFHHNSRLLYRINADGTEWFAPDLTEAERMYVETHRVKAGASVVDEAKG